MSDDLQTVGAIADKAEAFMTGFKDDAGHYRYFDRINQMVTGDLVLAVDFCDLPDELARLLRDKPDEVIKAFREALQRTLHNIHPDYEAANRDGFRVAFIGLDAEPNYRLDKEFLGKFISIVGKVHGIEEPQEVITKYVARCTNCGASVEGGKGGRKPRKCSACGEKDLDFDEEYSVIENQRFIMVLMSRNPGSANISEEDAKTTTVLVELQGDLVDADVYFGDEVQFFGIVRIDRSIEKQPRASVLAYSLYLEANNLVHLKKRQEEINLTDEDKQALELWVRDQGENLTSQLVKAYAPRVHGHDDLKEALLYQQVGGEVSIAIYQESREKPDINILLIGDAGTAKSELLETQARYAKGTYQSSEGISAAGIAAGLVKDERTGRYMYQAGFAVTSNGRLKALDEIDKLHPDHRKQLYTILERGKYHLGKVVRKELDAKGPWLVAGNPLYGRYDPYRNLYENINLPIPFLSRFDYIFIFRDIPDKEQDAEVLARIHARYKGSVDEITKGILDEEKLLKLIQYARKIPVTISDEAFAVLDETFHQLRKNEETQITYRQYFALVRSAIARAKLHLRNTVEPDDARRAVALYWQSFKSAGTDVNTGKVDVGVLQGKPRSEVTRQKLFLEIFEAISGSDRNLVDKQILVTELMKTGKFAGEQEIREFIEKQLRENAIYEKRPGQYLKS